MVVDMVIIEWYVYMKTSTILKITMIFPSWMLKLEWIIMMTIKTCRGDKCFYTRVCDIVGLERVRWLFMIKCFNVIPL